MTISPSPHLDKRHALREHSDVRQSPERGTAILQLLFLLHVGVEHHVAHVDELDVVLHHEATARRGEENAADVGRHDERRGSESERGDMK